MANRIVANYGKKLLSPLHDRLLVRRIKEEPKSGLIWIPDIAQENSQKAEIIALGPKCRDLQEGDTVLLPGIASKYPDWQDCDFMLVQQADVGGVLS